MAVTIPALPSYDDHTRFLVRPRRCVIHRHPPSSLLLNVVDAVLFIFTIAKFSPDLTEQLLLSRVRKQMNVAGNATFP